MDAREIIAEAACRPDRNKYETANYIIQRLAAVGYTIIHRDENHGPTLERAADILDAGVYASRHDTELAWDLAGRIRAMGEKK